MKAKHGNAGAVLLVLLGVWGAREAHAQMPMSPLPALGSSVGSPTVTPTAGLPPTGQPLGSSVGILPPTTQQLSPALPVLSPASLPPTGTPLGSPMPPTGTPLGSPMPPTGQPLGSPFPPTGQPLGSRTSALAPTQMPGQPLGTPVSTSSTAQDPAIPPYMQPLATDTALSPSGQLTPGCCGPMGRHGPIGTEVYLQTGPNILLSDTTFARSLQTGYGVGIAGRTLFFNRDATRDWNILIDANYIGNNGIPNNTFISNSGLPVTIRGLDRMTVGLGLGYDWFLLGSGYVGNATCNNLCVGFDGGARWGTSHVDLNVTTIPDGYNRIQRVFGEYFAGFRANLEIPMGGWTFLTGMRAEYTYSDLHVLPDHQNTALHGLNLMLTMGVRY